MSNNKNELKVITTSDGSYTIFNSKINESYHSTHGALQESKHVFIKYGFHLIEQPHIHILEIGLGTGLNAALTWIEASEKKIKTTYATLEPFPPTTPILNEVIVGYKAEIGDKLARIHTADWEIPVSFDPDFLFTKHQTTLEDYHTHSQFDLIYFDAFSPEVQPEMWTIALFKKMRGMLKQDGILTTYCAKGSVKRNLADAGFAVKGVNGPPGKREITIAIRKEV